DHIKHMTLVRTDGEIIECGPTLNQDWFFATLGRDRADGPYF
ncbi:hypothetical protein Rin_00008020, partial [Candidatus Regiella insecticola 5.15]